MASKKNVLLVGSGAVGTIAALNLETGGRAAVTAVLRSNYFIVKEKGFTINSCDHGLVSNWRPTKIVKAIPRASADAAPFDYIVVTTKDLPDCGSPIINQIACAVSPGITVIVLIQNGLNIERPWLEMFPMNIVLSGISMIGSEEAEQGIINHTARDILSVGAFPNMNADAIEGQRLAAEFVAIYAAAGKTSCTLTSDVGWDRWRKLVYNATFNPLCAITGLDSGSLQLAGGAVSTLVKPAMKEIVAAAAACGHIFADDMIERLIDEDPVESHFVPSMLQDVRKFNLIEHETILGEALKEGRRLGVAMPTISVLYHLCQVVQWRIQEQRKISH